MNNRTRTSRPARRFRVAVMGGLTAAALLAACTSGTESASPAPGSAPGDGGDPASLRVGVLDAPEPRKAAPEGSWAGAVAGTDAYLAVVSDGTQVMAYLCDGATVSTWFSADLTGADIVAAAKDGSVLTSTIGDDPKGALTGTVTGADGVATAFSLPAGDIGLYRADQGLDEEGGSALAGWVVLPDGTQKGALNLTTTTKATSGTATSTTAAPAASTTTVLAAPAVTPVSTVTAVPPAITVNTTVAPLVILLPTPITPGILSKGVPNRVREFVMVTLGDSYAAGEGAPNAPGDFSMGGGALGLPDGVHIPGGRRETWSQQPPNHPEVEACHRSDIAAGPLVAADLAAEFPDVRVIHQSFACSGAKIENLISARYPGADAEVDLPNGVTPQLDQVRNWFNRTGPVSFPGTDRKIDALYMNVGGNDFGFADVIGACISPPGLASECHEDAALARKVADAPANLTQRYEDLDTALRALSAADGSSLVPRTVFLSEAPNPLREADGSFCNGTLLPATLDPRLTKHGGIANLSNLFEPESRWVEQNVVIPLNRTIAEQRAAQGWTIVDTIAAASRTHGVCSDDSWINNNADALASQGKDARLEDLQWWLSAVGNIPGFVDLNISSGIVHPNAKGFRGMADEIKKKIRAQFLQLWKPPTPTRLRQGTTPVNGDLELRWDDLSAGEDRFEIEERILTNGAYASPLLPNLVRPAGSRSLVVDLNGGPYTAQYRIRACGPKAGTSLCSAWSTPVVASNVAPKAPTNATITLVGPRVSATFQDNSGPLVHGGPGAMVVGATDPAGTRKTFVIRAIGAVATTPQPATGSLTPKGAWKMNLQACTVVGCSSSTGEATVTVP